MRRLAKTAIAGLVIVCAAAAAGSASASDRVSFDPFRSDAQPQAHAAPLPHAPSLSPFRVADAQPAASPSTAPAAAPRPQAAAATAKACQSDDNCPAENFCAERGVCEAIQTRTNVLFLYYREGSFREILGLYWSKRGPSGYSVVVPFFWHYWTPKSQTRIVAPFYWSYRDYAARYSATVILPGLPVSWTSQPDAHSFGVWPLFYYSTKFGWAAPLFGSFEIANPDRKSSYGAMFLLYWWTHSPRRHIDLGIPIFFSRRTAVSAFTYAIPANIYWRDRDDKNLLVLPLLYWNKNRAGSSLYALTGYHTHRGTQSAGSLLWLYWFGSNERAGSAYDILFPLFYWQRSDHGQKSLWLSPIGAYRRDPDSVLHVVTPLFVRYWSKETGATTKLISLLLYLRSDPAGSTSVLFPLFWHFRDAASGASATALFPVFARRSGPRETTTVAGLFPLLLAYKRSFNDNGDGGGEGWGAGLYPLAFFGRRGDVSHGVIFPLFWRFKSANDSTTVAAPLFYHHADRRGSATGLPLLLTFFGHSDDDRYTIQFPLFWRFSNQREGWSTTVTPVGYHHTDRDGWSAGLPPLFFIGGGADHSHLAIVPLFWHFRDDKRQKSTTVVLAYWHRTEGGETTDAFFPLFYYRRGARPGGSDETSLTLFPLFHYRRDAVSRVVATPVGVSWKSGERAAGFIGPYVWYRGATFTASGVPLLAMDVTNRATGERTRQIGPWFAIDAPGRRSRVLVPFYGGYDDDQEHDTYVFPSFFRQRKADGYKVDALLPFYWHSGIGARTTTVIGPWYRHRDGLVHDTGVAPVFFYAKNAERSVLVIPPALLYRRADFKTNSVWLTAALVYHARGPDSHTTVVFPLWWSGHEKERSHRILFPLYWHFANEEQKSNINFVGPLYWASKDTTRTRGLLPVVWYSRDSASGASSNAFLPFFYQGSGPQQFRLFTAIAGYSRTGNAHTWYVGPVAASDSDKRRFRMLFPLWFSHENKTTEAWTRVVPPVLFVSRTTPQTSLTTALALFWHYRDIASATTLALPLYYDFHDLHESRTTVLVPLFVRHHRDSDDSTFLVAPLFYRRTNPTDSTTVAFPLVWDFKYGNNRTTLVLPFYAHWRRPSYSATYVFPTYYYREGLGPRGPDGTYRRVLAPFFETAVKRRGDYMWEVLGGLFGHESVGRNRYLKVFFMTFETKAPAHTQTSWYSQPIRASRREAQRGLNANIW